MGYTPENDIDRRAVGLPVVAFGKSYPSLAAAARAYGRSLATVRRRFLKLGFSLEDALTCEEFDAAGEPVTVEGITYRSMNAACRAFGVSRKRLKTRLSKGLSLAEALGNSPLPSPTNKPIIVCGRKFQSRTLMARYFGARSIGAIMDILAKYPDITERELLARLSGKQDRRKDTGYLYLVVCRQTNKWYFGITSRSVEDRFRGHLAAATRKPYSEFYSDIVKHGASSFTVHTIIKESLEVLAKVEQLMIKRFRTYDSEVGYNRHSGGSVGGIFGASTEVIFQSRVFRNLNTLCATLNISHYRTKRLLAEGYSVEDAVTEGLRWSKLTPYEKRSETNRERAGTAK